MILVELYYYQIILVKLDIHILINKNNFDSNNKRKIKSINKNICFKIMKKQFSSLLFKIANKNTNNKSKVFNYDEIKDLINEDLNEDSFIIYDN